MRIPRIFHSKPLSIGDSQFLDDDAANHVGRVLRMTTGEALCLFNGDGSLYPATITSVGKKSVEVCINDQQDNPVESPLRIHLGQGISRGDRMDFVIQKAVELGVSAITPLFTERCGVKLDADRLQKRTEQWQKIAISACEQSGRSVVPVIHTALPLEKWLAQVDNCLKLTLDPWTDATIKSQDPKGAVRLVIGPEGGFSDAEVTLTQQAGFLPVRLGPRVLRTETAALTAISALQLQWGDLA
jgi:16S rRNA (uracil1498-N3)-methyltransferase